MVRNWRGMFVMEADCAVVDHRVRVLNWVGEEEYGARWARVSPEIRFLGVYPGLFSEERISYAVC